MDDLPDHRTVDERQCALELLVQVKYYDAIARGEKVYEGRLYAKKHMQLSKGSLVLLTVKNGHHKGLAAVSGPVERFDSFKDMLQGLSACLRKYVHTRT